MLPWVFEISYRLCDALPHSKLKDKFEYITKNTFLGAITSYNLQVVNLSSLLQICFDMAI